MSWPFRSSELLRLPCQMIGHPVPTEPGHRFGCEASLISLVRQEDTQNARLWWVVEGNALTELSQLMCGPIVASEPPRLNESRSCGHEGGVA